MCTNMKHKGGKSSLQVKGDKVESTKAEGNPFSPVHSGWEGPRGGSARSMQSCAFHVTAGTKARGSLYLTRGL